MFTKVFWKDAAERAIKTFAQAVLAVTAVVAPSIGFELLNVNWIPVILVGVIASLMSVLTSIASSFKGDNSSASLVK